MAPLINHQYHFWRNKIAIRLYKHFVPALAITSTLVFSTNALASSEVNRQSKRNVILIIGDGMDDQQITIARNYLKGATGKLVVDVLPHRYAVQVLTVDEDNPSQPVYVADSANSATAIATGEVTSRGRIATSPGDGKALTTIVELAKSAGLGTGIVTTASITDATPASFVAHINDRYCQDPTAMVNAQRHDSTLTNCTQYLHENGGMGSIAEQLATSEVDILLGGGLDHFQRTVSSARGENSLTIAREHGYQVITRRAELDKIGEKTKLLGLFAPDTLPVSLRAENESSANTLVNSPQDKAKMPDSYRCEANPASNAVPTLSEMMAAALKRLADSEHGFFLMVEAASIDKESHYRRPCGSIGELQELDDSVQLAMAFAEQQSDTLVLVTADHGQAAQLIPFPSLFEGLPGAHSPGHVAVLRTEEGGTIAVNYATNSAVIEEHTGTQVPLLSNKQLPSGFGVTIQQPELFTIMRNYLGLQSRELSVTH